MPTFYSQNANTDFPKQVEQVIAQERTRKNWKWWFSLSCTSAYYIILSITAMSRGARTPPHPPICKLSEAASGFKWNLSSRGHNRECLLALLSLLGMVVNCHINKKKKKKRLQYSGILKHATKPLIWLGQNLTLWNTCEDFNKAF